MSYTLAVVATDADSRDRMLDFLQRQDWSAIEEPSDYTEVRPLAGDTMGAYPPVSGRERMLGFAFSSVPDHVWAVCAWVAVKIGERDAQARPVVFYDKQALPIVVGRDPTAEEKGRTRCDERGVLLPSNKPSTFKMLISPANRREAQVRAFVEQLDEAWGAVTPSLG